MNAERQPTDTSAPVPVDAARDLLAALRALEARVAALESLLVPPFAPRYWIEPPLMNAGPYDALSAALRLPTVPDAYGR